MDSTSIDNIVLAAFAAGAVGQAGIMENVGSKTSGSTFENLKSKAVSLIWKEIGKRIQHLKFSERIWNKVQSTLDYVEEAIKRIGGPIIDELSEQTIAALGLATFGLGALFSGVKQMSKTFQLIHHANKRLKRFQKRFAEEIETRLSTIKQTAKDIEEKVNAMGISNATKIKNLENIFERTCNDVTRMKYALTRFQKDFKNAMLSENRKLEKREKQLSESKWWKIGVSAVGITVAAIATGGIVVASGVVAAVGGLGGASLNQYGQYLCTNELKRFQEFDELVQDTDTEFQSAENKIGIEKKLYEKKINSLKLK